MMKLVNKNNKVEKEVDDVTGKLMIGTGEWEVAKEKTKGTLGNAIKE